MCNLCEDAGLENMAIDWFDAKLLIDTHFWFCSFDRLSLEHDLYNHSMGEMDLCTAAGMSFVTISPSVTSSKDVSRYLHDGELGLGYFSRFIFIIPFLLHLPSHLSFQKQENIDSTAPGDAVLGLRASIITKRDTRVSSDTGCR